MKASHALRGPRVFTTYSIFIPSHLGGHSVSRRSLWCSASTSLILKRSNVSNSSASFFQGQRSMICYQDQSWSNSKLSSIVLSADAHATDTDDRVTRITRLTGTTYTSLLDPSRLRLMRGEPEDLELVRIPGILKTHSREYLLR